MEQAHYEGKSNRFGVMLPGRGRSRRGNIRETITGSPARIRGVSAHRAMARPPAFRVGQKQAGEPVTEFIGNLLQFIIFPDRVGIDGERIAIEIVIALKRFNEQIVEREPDWATPV